MDDYGKFRELESHNFHAPPQTFNQSAEEEVYKQRMLQTMV